MNLSVLTLFSQILAAVKSGDYRAAGCAAGKLIVAVTCQTVAELCACARPKAMLADGTRFQSGARVVKSFSAQGAEVLPDWRTCRLAGAALHALEGLAPGHRVGWRGGCCGDRVGLADASAQRRQHPRPRVADALGHSLPGRVLELLDGHTALEQRQRSRVGRVAAARMHSGAAHRHANAAGGCWRRRSSAVVLRRRVFSRGAVLVRARGGRWRTGGGRCCPCPCPCPCPLVNVTTVVTRIVTLIVTTSVTWSVAWSATFIVTFTVTSIVTSASLASASSRRGGGTLALFRLRLPRFDRLLGLGQRGAQQRLGRGRADENGRRHGAERPVTASMQ